MWMPSSAAQALPGPGETPVAGRSYLALSGAGGQRDYAYGSTVGGRLSLVASRHPRRDAIRWLDGDELRSTTWEELHRIAVTVGAALQRMRPSGRKIGIYGHTRAEWIHAMYGAARAGLGVVPLPDDTPAAVHDLCIRLRIDVVVVTSDVMPPDTAESGVGYVSVRDLVESPFPRDGLTTGPVRSEDPFLFQFTSGTTGTPKIAVLSHRAVLGSAEAYIRGAGGDEGAALFNPLPLQHVGGSVAGLIAALTVEGTYVSVDRFDAATAGTLIRRTEPTVVGLVPTMIIDMLEAGMCGPADFASVVSVVGGATTVDPTLIDKVERELGITFLVAYGQSEAPCLTLSGRRDPTLLRTRTIGRPLKGRDYLIADETGAVPDGTVGELCVRGPLIMTGYLDDSGDVRTVTDEHGWMRTGDLCSLEDGIVTFHSRIRDVVVRGGENLYPAEIEPVIAKLPAVAEVSIFGLPDVRLGERLVAAVRTVPGADLTAEALTSYCAEHLPRRKQPTEWFFVEDFPRTSTGKVRKPELIREFTPPAGDDVVDEKRPRPVI